MQGGNAKGGSVIMTQTVTCPSCGTRGIDVCSYASMMVVKSDLALFKVECPACHTMISSLQSIPLQLRESVRSAALSVDAGMGLEG